MNRLLPHVMLGLLLSSAASLPAQQTIGISMSGVLSTSVGVYCGFDCNSATNTGRVVGLPGAAIGVTLFGDVGLPGVLAIGLGPAFQPCPGFPLPGIDNSLQIDPANLLITSPVSPLVPGNRTCSAPGSAPALTALPILPGLSGLTLTFQGLVFDQSVPAFTRAIEMTVR